MRRLLSIWQRSTDDRAPESLSPDEFDRETGAPLPTRASPAAQEREKIQIIGIS